MKRLGLLLALLTLPVSISYTSASAEVDNNSNGYIVGKEENTIVENGLIVQTQESWVLNSDSFFEVTLESPYQLQENDYLAIEFEVTRHVYDYFICKFGVNGNLFSVGADGSQTVNTFSATSNGGYATVSQKYNFFFFANKKYI